MFIIVASKNLSGGTEWPMVFSLFERKGRE